MSILAKVTDFFAGGTIGAISDVAEKWFPPSMSEAEKSTLKLKIQEAEAAKEIELRKLANEADQNFNDRIKTMEGTASDLLAVPIVGRIIIFARGAQRPVWGFSTLWLDYKVFSSAWDISEDPQLISAFYVINILVLGFLFGERAIKNIMPIIMPVISSYLGKKIEPEK
jgi:hypothetical protein